MTRDELLAEISRAVHAAYPDRAENILVELELWLPRLRPDAHVKAALECMFSVETGIDAILEIDAIRHERMPAPPPPLSIWQRLLRACRPDR